MVKVHKLKLREHGSENALLQTFLLNKPSFQGSLTSFFPFSLYLNSNSAFISIYQGVILQVPTQNAQILIGMYCSVREKPELCKESNCNIKIYLCHQGPSLLSLLFNFILRK